MSNLFEEHIKQRPVGALTGAEYVARLKTQVQRERKERNAVSVAPHGKRPHCKHCNRELRLYRCRKAGSAKLYGTYGDNLFCGLTCGWRFAIKHAEEKCTQTK
jgi:RNase P subunit RPR2